MKQTETKLVSLLSIRIKDADVLSLLYELVKKTGNRNAVLNEALNIGVPLLYERTFNKEVTINREKREIKLSTERKLKEILDNIKDLFVEMITQEVMIAGLYNTKIAELDGETVRAEELLDGSICDLPELVAGLKADLTESCNGGDE